MRMYTRLFLVKNPGPDDFLIVGSMVSGLFPEFYSVANGPQGKHNRVLWSHYGS